MRSCLVVDHSHVVRKVARRIFETMQFEIDEAESGQEALEKCEAAMPDTILLDGHIPTMSSTELLASIRSLTEGRKPFIIYCTSENDQSEIARALTAGADDYVLKPFDKDGMRAKLTAAGMKV